MRRPPLQPRSAIAVVEFAILLPVLLLFLSGIWVVGTMIKVHQILDWSAREAARISSQGQVINLSGAYTQITVTTSTPSVTSTVQDYLEANGISATGLIVEYENLTMPTSTEPWESKKGERIRVTVKLPHDNVRLPVVTRLPSWALPNPDYLTTTLDFYSMADDPFTVDDQLPAWQGF